MGPSQEDEAPVPEPREHALLSIGRGVILFGDRTNDVVSLNRPATGCAELGVGRPLKTRNTKAPHRRGGIATAFDPVGGIE